jgi:hypothetical protein
MQNILASQAQQRAAGTQQQTAELQQQKAQMEMVRFKRQQEGLDKFLEASAKGGKTGSPEEVADGFYSFALTQEDPQLILSAQTMRQAARERSAYQASRRPPKISPVGPASGTMGSGTYDMDQNEPMFNLPSTQPLTLTTPVSPRAATPAALTVNQLAPPFAAAAAPVNQLGVDTTALQNKINDLRTLYPNVPQAQKEADRLEKQLDEANKLYTVGGNLVTGTGKSIFTAPPTKTELERNFAFAKTPAGGNYKGSFAEFKAISTPKTSVSYGPQEKAEKIEYGKLLIDDFKNIKAQATVATKSLPAIESNLAILDKGFDTGFGTETIAAGARVLGALGVQNAKDFATDAQTFLASANAAVLQRQLEQKGPQTESDAQRITATGAQLGNTKEANKFVLNVAKAQLQRDLKQREFYAAWREKNKTFEGAEDAWYASEGGKSLFDSPALKKYGTNVVDQIPGQSRAAPVATTIPQAAIDALKSGKGTDAQFDAIFGAGAAKRARGGK